MYLDVKPSVVLDGQKRLTGIYCYPNGSFSLVVELKDKRTEILLATPSGELRNSGYDAKQGVLLGDNYILSDFAAKNNFAGTNVFNGIIATGKLYSSANNVLREGFEEFKVFANGWYMLIFKENKELYTKEGNLIAQNFIDAKPLDDNYYALRQDSPLYKTGNWAIYKDNVFKKVFKNVVDFVGNGLIVRANLTDNFYELVDIKENVLAQNIKTYNKFYNNCFSLTFNNDSLAMYSGSGKRISAFTGQDVSFLPDGTFISFSQKIIDSRYRSNGLMIKEEILRCNQLSNYFLITKENKTELYNDKGEIIDEDILIAKEMENFALFQKEERYHLYNQYGKVFEFNTI